jgi:hypothetical protein
MKLQLKTRRLIPGIFVILSAASAINLVLASRDYLLLYTSLSQLQFTISKLSLQGAIANETSILLQLEADNPVDYGGLRPTRVTISTYFVSGNSSLFDRIPVARSWMINQTLAPHMMTVWIFPVTLNSQNATSLSTFYNAHNGIVTAKTFSVVSVSSFLDMVTGSPSFFQENKNITLTR